MLVHCRVSHLPCSKRAFGELVLLPKDEELRTATRKLISGFQAVGPHISKRTMSAAEQIFAISKVSGLRAT